MHVKNMIIEFKLQKVKHLYTIKEYRNKFLKMLVLLKQIIVTVLERHEALVTSLENTKDLFTILLVVIFQAQEYKRFVIVETMVEFH